MGVLNMKKFLGLLIIIILISGCEEKKITNENNEKQQLEKKLIGTWKSSGVQYQIYNENYDPEKEIPLYILELNENKKVKFQMDDVELSGTYSISDDLTIFVDIGGSTRCKLNEDTLECMPPIGTMKKQD